MSLQHLKDEALKARKEKNKARADVLVTMLSDVNMAGKNEQREATDADVAIIAKRFMKNLEKTKALRSSPELLEEISVVQEFMPKVASALSLDDAIVKVLTEHSDKIKKENIGFLVGQVMRACQGKANPKTANEMITAKISEAG